MKQTTLIIGIFLSLGSMYAQPLANVTNAADSTFIKAMETNLRQLDTATVPASLKKLANNFERIGKVAQKQWEPWYYAAYCYALLAAGSKNKSDIDGIEDQADQMLVKASLLSKENSEISTLKAMIVYTRLLVDPVNRWQTMGKEGANYLQHARLQDPSNPRPLLIEARTLLYTPEGLGGGSKAARPVIENALAKLAAFVPANSIAPSWGRALAENLALAIKAQ